MNKTNFNSVGDYLKAALTELKKGEHDQLASSLFQEGNYNYKYIATIEEVIKHLISDVEIVRIRWGTNDEQED